jgi:hypothetical protein
MKIQLFANNYHSHADTLSEILRVFLRVGREREWEGRTDSDLSFMPSINQSISPASLFNLKL